jgi:2-methylcitrate dehydratase
VIDQILANLAAFSSTLTYGDLPAAAVVAAKERLLDAIACAIGAYDCDTAEVGRKLAGPAANPALAGRMLGSKKLAAADAAAFVNSCMIRNLDLNDIIQGGHPSDCLGALLAVAPQIGASGERLITAMVITYEIIIRLQRAARIREKGWDQGYALGVGTAAGLANLMGFSREATQQAIAITATGNVPMRATRAGQLSMWKGAATAYAVRNAVFGVQLAAAGMTGPEAPFTGRHGLTDLISGPIDLAPFGTTAADFFISTVYIKYWPVAYSLQSVIWAGIELRKQVAADQLASVVVQTYEFSWNESGNEPAKWDPRTRETADHSIPYVLARTLLHGLIDQLAFVPDAYLDPTIRPLMNSIEVRVDDGIEKEVQRGVIHLHVSAKDRSGKTYEVDIVNPPGHDKNPFTVKDLAAKFTRLCEPKLGKRRTAAALRHWQNIETCTDLKPALDALIVKAASGRR